jgi:hypothetical protein
MDIRFSGARDLADIRRALRDLDDKTITRRLSKGLAKTTEPLTKEIRAEAGRTMPSGYGPTLSKSLRFRRSTRERSGTARVELRIYGDGAREERDIRRLNRGELRHPVFGRSRRIRRGPKAGTVVRNPWAVQHVRKGFVDRPVDRLGPGVRREMDALVDEIADQIISAR